MAEPAIKLDIVPSHALASRILENANSIIKGLSPQSYFKIGQTTNPVHRWCEAEYGYKQSSNVRWLEMRVVGILAHGEAAGFLEAALISQWYSEPRCLNEAHGGEAVSKQEGPFCVYVAVAANGLSCPKS